MAKNKVQFQKSMNIHAFIQRYGSEDLCLQRLFDIRWPRQSHRDSRTGHPSQTGATGKDPSCITWPER